MQIRAKNSAYIFCRTQVTKNSDIISSLRKEMMKMIFEKGSVPVRIAAKVYGKNPEWVRLGIVSGYLPIGDATRNGHQITDVSDLECKYGRTNFYS